MYQQFEGRTTGWNENIWGDIKNSSILQYFAITKYAHFKTWHQLWIRSGIYLLSQYFNCKQLWNISLKMSAKRLLYWHFIPLRDFCFLHVISCYLAFDIWQTEKNIPPLAFSAQIKMRFTSLITKFYIVGENSVIHQTTSDLTLFLPLQHRWDSCNWLLHDHRSCTVF